MSNINTRNRQMAKRMLISTCISVFLFTITLISPIFADIQASGSRNETLEFVVRGQGFDTGMQILLVKDQYTVLDADDEFVANGGDLTGRLNLAEASSGLWDIVIADAGVTAESILAEPAVLLEYWNPNGGPRVISDGLMVLQDDITWNNNSVRTTVGDGYINFNWDHGSSSTGQVGYNLYIGDEAGQTWFYGPLATDQNFYHLCNQLEDGVTYSYEICITDSEGIQRDEPATGTFNAQTGLAETQNPSFEDEGQCVDGAPLGWTCSNDWELGLTTFAVVGQDEACSGGYAVKVSTQPAGDGSPVTSALISDSSIELRKNELYEYKVRVKTDSSQWIRLVLFDYGYARSVIKDFSTSESFGEWTELSLTYTPDMKSSFFMRIDQIISGETETANLWIDDISLLKIETTTKFDMKVPNGKFDLPTTTRQVSGLDLELPLGWNVYEEEAYMSDYGLDAGVRRTGGFDGGSYAYMTISSDGNNAKYAQFFHDYMEVDPEAIGQKHRARFWLRTDQRQMVRAFLINGGFEVNRSLILNSGSAPDIWREYEVTFIPTEQYFMIRFDNIALDGNIGYFTLDIDDVSIEVVE
jgi:hypothetical protein